MISLRLLLRNALRHSPSALQVAAICRRGKGAMTEVLLVTSLDTRRNIVPKGWPMPGKTLAEAALREAWEEAGVVGRIHDEPVGTYHYLKRRKSGLELHCKVLCFIVEVEDLAEDYPEAGRRTRQFIPPREAAKRVQERELKRLLRGLS